MANKNVIVLVPNGRRQKVGVTPNTTILQVIEEVCQKHGFNANDYDLKHFNKVLDSSAILRFTGLANNAQLEMVPCTKIRSTSAVVIGVQLENGERLMGEFTPNSTLAEILLKVKPDEDFEKVTLIYMHREIFGNEILNSTTLKSLGINNGKAVLRLIHKNPQTTSNVIIAPPIMKKPVNNETTNKNKRQSEIDHSNKRSNAASLLKTGTQQSNELQKRLQDMQKEIKEEKESKIIASTSRSENSNEEQISTEPRKDSKKCAVDNLKKIEFLGERNALIFNQAAIQGITRDELPDEFYDLTVDDAKILLRDMQRYRKELEEAPLLTNVQRQTDHEKRTQNQLNKYRRTIIRVYFPDQFVLQGLFQPTETVKTVKDFIGKYLQDANSDFEIFTTPPKRILDSDAQLIDECLVPCAIVHYSGPSTLKSDVKQKFTDPKDVELQVARVRMSMIAEENRAKNEDAEPSASASSKQTDNESSCEKQAKTPKWFPSSSFK